ncbi:DUF1232 domain-containing protein [Skermanella stibiiresistens]|uniref:DUF1232 domain-containing protein n=1 Tax=Skermanella stibiiresistens TaxID=913326 RepID=UPI000A07566B
MSILEENMLDHTRKSEISSFIYSIVLFILSILAIKLLFSTVQVVTFGDLIIVSIILVFFMYYIKSFFRSPKIFLKALLERIVFLVWIPFVIITIIFLFLIRMGFMLSKIVVSLSVSAIYFVMPIDMIPDFFLGIGQIDDVLLFITLIVWSFSKTTRMALVESIKLKKPTTKFP